MTKKSIKFVQCGCSSPNRRLGCTKVGRVGIPKLLSVEQFKNVNYWVMKV